MRHRRPRPADLGGIHAPEPTPAWDEPPDAYRSDIGPLEAVRRHRWLAAAVLLTTLALSLVAALVPSRPHRATADVAISDPRGSADVGQSNGSPGDLNVFARQRAAYMRSTQVLEAAAGELGNGETASSLAGDVTVKAPPDGAVLTVTARANTADRAIARLRAVIRSYHRLTAAQTRANADLVLRNVGARLRSSEADLAALLRHSAGARSVEFNAAVVSVANLVRQQIQVSVATAQYGDGIDYVNFARDNGGVASLRPTLGRNAVLGVAVGVLLAIWLCWLMASRRPIVANAEDVVRLTGLPVLSEVAEVQHGRAPALTNPASMPTPDYQRAVTALRAQVERGVIAVVSPCREDGRSISAAHLAVAAARDGLRVALVDADLRARGASSLFDIEDVTPGLADALAGARRADVERERILDDGASITLVPPGSPSRASAASAYRSEGMQTFLADLATRFDYIFVDTPAALSAPEAEAVALVSDAVLLVARAGAPAGPVVRLRDQLALLSTPVVGALLTRRRGGSDEGNAYASASVAARARRTAGATAPVPDMPAA